MYSIRLFLKSFFIFFLLSCQSNTTVYTQTETSSTKNIKIEQKKSILCGAERLDVYLPYLDNKKVGIVANPTSMIQNVHLVDSLLSLNIHIQKVFSPEHGFRGKADAGEKVQSNVDAKTGLPIISLYGDNKKPKAEQLNGIDILIFDLQDVGTRFYTYISTLHYVMEAAAESNIPLIVLDRPNPNGHYVDGPVRKEGFASFVSLDPIPVVHGMTIGELAQMMNGEGWLKNNIQCDLTVIPCENYNHQMAYSLPVSPSPNLRTDASIALYPSLCFFEGTIVSVGRGTTTPFEIYGHPDLKKDSLLYSFTFTPQSSFGAKHPKLENQLGYGKNLNDFATNNRIHQLHLSWLIDAYQQLKRKDFFRADFFDLLAGTDVLRKQIISGLSESEIRASWEEDLSTFKEKRAKYLLYE